MEAAEVLGFTRIQQIRYVILPHVSKVLFPPLSNHYILMTLGTSMAAIFGVEELTGRAMNVNAETSARSKSSRSLRSSMYSSRCLLQLRWRFSGASRFGPR